jgi:hypothetical protein
MYGIDSCGDDTRAALRNAYAIVPTPISDATKPTRTAV